MGHHQRVALLKIMDLHDAIAVSFMLLFAQNLVEIVCVGSGTTIRSFARDVGQLQTLGV